MNLIRLYSTHLISLINLIHLIIKNTNDMKAKNEVITLTVKGITIDFVVINFISRTYYDKTDEIVTKYLCYGQNRLVIVTETNGVITYNNTMCDYCVIPEADEILENVVNNI